MSEEFNEEIYILKKGFFWFLGIILLVSFSGFVVSKCSEAAHVQDAVIVYEEYQEIYNTCTKLNTDLGNMQSLPENDVMFEQFSKAQRVNTIKTELNRWVEVYNGKSKMWGRSLWKSSSLPYQLSVNDFSNYNNK
jgi:hypothetical protein